MKAIFLKVTEKLKTIEALRWIDGDEGQLDYYETRPPVSFPCALVDVELTDCQDQGETIQLVTARVTLRLAFEPLGQTNTAAPVSVQNKALEKWDTVDTVFATLQGWGDEQISELSRVSQTTEKRDDNIRVIRQVWETYFMEEASLP
jgi:hypothetical protein